MKNFKKGEIATLLTIASFIVISVASLISANLSKQSQTTKAKAEGICRQGFPNDGGCDRCGNDGRFTDVPINWWDTGCLDFCRNKPNDAGCLWCDFAGKEHQVGPFSQGDNDLTGKNCSTWGTVLTPMPEPIICSMMDPITRRIIPDSKRQACDSLNKCDVNGGCNPSCCKNNDECPQGMTCTNSNGYCQNDFACEKSNLVPPLPTFSPSVSPSIQPNGLLPPTSSCPADLYECIFGSVATTSILGPAKCVNDNSQKVNIAGCKPVDSNKCSDFAENYDKCLAAKNSGKKCEWFGGYCNKCADQGKNPCNNDVGVNDSQYANCIKICKSSGRTDCLECSGLEGDPDLKKTQPPSVTKANAPTSVIGSRVKKTIHIDIWDPKINPYFKELEATNVAIYYSDYSDKPKFDAEYMAIEKPNKLTIAPGNTSYIYEISYMTGLRPGKREWFCIWNKVKTGYYCPVPLN